MGDPGNDGRTRSGKVNGPVYGIWHRLALRRRWILTLCVLPSLGLLFAVSTAWAHGGGTPQVTNADAGPYWVTVWTQPEPLQVGETHITVAVSEPGVVRDGQREAGAPVMDAVVEVHLEPLDRPGEPLTVSATHEGASNKLFYEADPSLPAAGQWGVLIRVQVSSSKSFNWSYVIGLGLLGVVVVSVVQRLREQTEDRVE
jgi:hypothetical protein